jgi:hypothetical protein
MEEFNNSESQIFKDTLEKQKKFITERLKTIKNKYLDDDFIIAPQKTENIVRHFNNGIAANTIQTFFNYKTDTCIFCKEVKGDNGIRQIERAHCNNYSRSDILILAVTEIRKKLDDGEVVTAGEILKKFIEKHDCCPIYMLCNKCHNKYDN